MNLYEIEVKSILVAERFPPSLGWVVDVHLDAMELGKGKQAPAKAAVAKAALDRLTGLGVRIGVDREFGVDINARHPEEGQFLIEAKGRSRLQKEMGFYSALGQLLTKIGEPPWPFKVALAFPDHQPWIQQLSKLPNWLRAHLSIDIYLASEKTVRTWSYDSP